MWLSSADTLFWELSIDHNMDIYYQVKYMLRAPTLARKFDISHWLHYGADGQNTVTRLPKFLGWKDYQIFLGMGPAIILNLALFYAENQ